MEKKLNKPIVIAPSEVVALVLIEKMLARKKYIENLQARHLTKSLVKEWQKLKTVEKMFLN